MTREAPRWKYRQIANYLQIYINQNNLKHGDLLPSEQQLCTRFDCSRGTVRQAVDVLVRERLVCRRQGAGMFVDETYRMNKEKTSLIAAIVPHITTSALGRFVQELGMALTQRGHTLLLGVTSDIAEVENQFIEEITRLNVVGIVKFPTNIELEENTRARIRELGIPYVIINDFWTDSRKDHHLAYNEDVAVELAMDHLVELGHRRIALVDYGGWARNGIVDAFTRELECRDLPMGKHSLVFHKDNEFCGFDKLYASGGLKPTAFVTVYDVLAVAVTSKLAEAGLRVPQDVSVVSLNGRPTVGLPFNLDLTAAVPPNTDMIDEALKILIDRVNGNRIHHTVFRPDFYIGNTTGPCPEKASDATMHIEDSVARQGARV